MTISHRSFHVISTANNLGSWHQPAGLIRGSQRIDINQGAQNGGEAQGKNRATAEQKIKQQQRNNGLDTSRIVWLVGPFGW
jgi:hypothetical protein